LDTLDQHFKVPLSLGIRNATVYLSISGNACQ